MEPHFWHARWQANEIGFHQAEINPHLQTYWPALQAAARGRVFVPLCGKSRDMLWLASQGQRVLGVEISPIAVQDFLRENCPAPDSSLEPPFSAHRCDEITLLEGDFFALTAAHLDAVTAVYDRAALIALPPQMRGRYAQHMASLLPPAVPVLLVTLEYPQPEMDGPPFAVTAADVDTLFGKDFQIDTLGGQDILTENPRFQARGLTRLHEQVYRLRRR